MTDEQITDEPETDQEINFEKTSKNEKTNKMIDTVTQELEKYKSRLKEMKPSDGEVYYKIDFISVKDADWHTYMPKKHNIEEFVEHCKSLSSAQGSDALRINFYKKENSNVPFMSEIVKTTKTHIPAIDDELNSSKKTLSPSYKNIEAELPASANSGITLLGLAEEIKSMKSGSNTDDKIEKALTEKIVEIKKDLKIEKLEGDIITLKNKIAEQDQEYEDLIGEMEEAENQIVEYTKIIAAKDSETNKLMSLGMLQIGGRFLNIPKTELAQLSGLLMGNNDEGNPKQLAENPGGLEEEITVELSGADKKKHDDIVLITTWLKNALPEHYENACYILVKGSANPVLFGKLREKLLELEKNNQQNNNLNNNSNEEIE